MKRIAVYPGTFDPITNGHLDIIERACLLFDEVHLVIAVNFNKKTTFESQQRYQMVAQSVEKLSNVIVVIFDGLIVDYALKVGANAIIRGIRALNDFEYEFQMSMMNQDINKDIEMIFLMAKKENTFISSSIIKELASYNYDVSRFVPSIVNSYLIDKYKK